MKISFNSLIVRTLLLLFIFSAVFIGFIGVNAKSSFSQGYIDLVNEDISSIKENILPSIALNLSYDLPETMYDIVSPFIKNKKILFLKIESSTLQNDLIFSATNSSIESLIADGNFPSISTLYDPATKEPIGKLTLIYSNKSYTNYMKKFYNWFGLGLLLFMLAMMSLGYVLYSSLKHLNMLAHSFSNFNPNKPENFVFDNNLKDEIAVIAKSANIMVDKLTAHIDKTKNLNEIVLQKENHLKDAQRMAKVGSFEYQVVEDILTLSDEYYRILGINRNFPISWQEFLNFISENDYSRVVHTIEYALEKGSRFHLRYSILLRNSKKIFIQTRGKVRKKSNGSIKITAISMDITTDVQNKKMIERLAYYDALTGLANRTLLTDRMKKALQNARRKKESLGIIFLDLDHFKLINDTLGHSVGDELLIYISKLLALQLRESDTISRLGGDEFVILLPFIHNDNDAIIIAKKIQNALQNKHDIGTHQLYITSSIGLSIYPHHGHNADELIRNADTAMYEAKNDGRNKYKMYSKKMGNFIDKQLSLEQDLTEAIKSKEQIELFYQAKIDAKSKLIIGAEVLVRWRHPTKGLIFPDAFIHIAESTGLMIALGNIITKNAIKQIQEFNNLGFSGLKIAINLSARQFQDSRLVPYISSMLNIYQIDPKQVEFEVTESVSMSNMANTLRILEELKAIGVSIAIDDFGTGYSSLAYLKKFPIHVLKIDQSFVFGIIEDEEDRVITQTIISMAHSLGLKTVAEGVETQAHVDMLEDMGCDTLQGYFYSKPVPKNEFISLLMKESNN